MDASARQAAAKRVVRSLRPLLSGLVALVALGVAGWVGGLHAYRWAMTSDKWALQSIQIEGNHRAPEAELLRLAGLSLGQNLFKLDIPAIERALTGHPWVRKAEARRHFPQSLVVHIEEHQPAAMVSLGDLYVVDEAGEPFKRLHAQDGIDVPLVTGVDRETFVSKRDETRDRLKGAVEMALAYEASVVSHGAPLSEVRLEPEGVTLVTGPGGQEVRMGEGGTKEKLARLVKVRTELARRGVQARVIHLDNRSRPGWVAVKLAIAGSERTGDSPQ